MLARGSTNQGEGLPLLSKPCGAVSGAKAGGRWRSPPTQGKASRQAFELAALRDWMWCLEGGRRGGSSHLFRERDALVMFTWCRCGWRLSTIRPFLPLWEMVDKIGSNPRFLNEGASFEAPAGKLIESGPTCSLEGLRLHVGQPRVLLEDKRSYLRDVIR